MTVYFNTNTEFDLDTIRIMGVSVKLGENPIGYFGTGLKYALAILLRTGHTVTLTTGGVTYPFTVREKTIRGATVQQVYMRDEALPFTLDLGWNWEVWQAYRELHSNTLDEGGATTTNPAKAGTVISVQGEAIETVHHGNNVFLTSSPIEKLPSLEVHKGASRYIYYRGVRCGQLKKPAGFTYNITTEMKLTEDRTFAQPYSVELALESALPTLTNKKYLRELCEMTDTYEAGLNYTYCSAPSPEFLHAAERVKSDANVNHSIHQLLERHTKVESTFTPTPHKDLSPSILLALRTTVEACETYLSCSLRPQDVGICPFLGQGVYGLYHRGKDKIYLTQEALERGTPFSVAVLYEEYCHQKLGHVDNSREFQSHLLHKMVYYALQGATK